MFDGQRVACDGAAFGDGVVREIQSDEEKGLNSYPGA